MANLNIELLKTKLNELKNKDLTFLKSRKELEDYADEEIRQEIEREFESKYKQDCADAENRDQFNDIFTMLVSEIFDSLN